MARKRCFAGRQDVFLIFAILLLPVAVIFGHLLPGLDNSVIQNGIRNSLHIIVFAIFAVILYESMGRLRVPLLLITTSVIVVVVAGLSEFMQYSAGKHLDPADVARDLFGAALALGNRWLLRYTRLDRISSAARRVLRATAALAGVTIVLPLLYWLSIISLNRSMFPTILGFENWWETPIYHSLNAQVVPLATNAPAPAGTAAAVHLATGRRSGLRILPMVSDWTDYEYLTFIAAMIHGPDTTVTVRINDSARLRHFSNHFMVSVDITDDSAVIRVPLHEIIFEPGRKPIDISDIQEIVILTRNKRNGTVLMLDEFRLE